MDDTAYKYMPKTSLSVEHELPAVPEDNSADHDSLSSGKLFLLSGLISPYKRGGGKL
jgi:hypothetical protein